MNIHQKLWAVHKIWVNQALLCSRTSNKQISNIIWRPQKIKVSGKVWILLVQLIYGAMIKLEVLTGIRVNWGVFGWCIFMHTNLSYSLAPISSLGVYTHTKFCPVTPTTRLFYNLSIHLLFSLFMVRMTLLMKKWLR